MKALYTYKELVESHKSLIKVGTPVRSERPGFQGVITEVEYDLRRNELHVLISWDSDNRSHIVEEDWSAIYGRKAAPQ